MTFRQRCFRVTIANYNDRSNAANEKLKCLCFGDCLHLQKSMERVCLRNVGLLLHIASSEAREQLIKFDRREIFSFFYLLNITWLNLPWRISSKLLHFTYAWREHSVYSGSEHCFLKCRTVSPPEFTSPLKLCSFFLPGVSAVWRWSKTRKALSSEIRNLLHMRDNFNDRLPRASWKVAYAVDQWRVGKTLCVLNL